MKNNNTPLGYTGLVTLSLKIGDKIVKVQRHNAGLPNLMKSICKFLTGQGDQEHEIPEFLDLRRRLVGTGDPWDTFITQQVSCGTTGRIYEYDTEIENWIAVYTFSIPYSILVDYVEVDDEIHEYRFVLYSEDAAGNPMDLAFIPVSAAELSRITPGLQAIVEWRIQIVNAPDDDADIDTQNSQEVVNKLWHI